MGKEDYANTSLVNTFYRKQLTGTCWSLPVLGGWLADSVGKFPVIQISMVIYLVGALLLVLGSITKQEIQHSDWESDVLTDKTFLVAIYISGLSLAAVGIGGMKSNVCPFGAEQLPNNEPPTNRGTGEIYLRNASLVCQCCLYLITMNPNHTGTHNCHLHPHLTCPQQNWVASNLFEQDF